MAPCEIADDLRAQLQQALSDWYEVEEILNNELQSAPAEKRVHNIQRALGQHVVKHGCNKD